LDDLDDENDFDNSNLSEESTKIKVDLEDTKEEASNL
jgi:hypothetical protein